MTDGTPCDDGNATTTGDTCKQGACEGAPLADEAPIRGLSLDPDAIVVGETSEVNFTATIARDRLAGEVTIHLERISAEAMLISDEGPMSEDPFDATQLRLRKSYGSKEPTVFRFRVRVDAADGTRLATSEPTALVVFAPLSDMDVASMAEILAKGAANDDAARLAMLRQESLVLDADTVPGALWVRFTNGIEAEVLLGRGGTKGGSVPRTLGRVELATAQAGSLVGSNGALILSPFADEFGNDDDGRTLKDILADTNSQGSCLKYSTSYIENAAVSVDTFKTLGGHGLIHISTHGTVDLVGRPALLTRTAVLAAPDPRYQADLFKGRLGIGDLNGTLWLSIKPGFIGRYVGSLPSSLVVVSACQSATTSALADAFAGHGSSAFLGFTGTPSSAFANDKVRGFYNRWLDHSAGATTVASSYARDCSGDACWTLFGDAQTAEPLQLCIQKLGDAASACRVSSTDGSGLDCGSTCQGRYEMNGLASLSVDAPSISLFEWGGDCASLVQDRTPQLQMTKDTECTATFGCQGDQAWDGTKCLRPDLTIDSVKYGSVGVTTGCDQLTIAASGTVNLRAGKTIKMYVDYLTTSPFPVRCTVAPGGATVVTGVVPPGLVGNWTLQTGALLCGDNVFCHNIPCRQPNVPVFQVRVQVDDPPIIETLKMTTAMCDW
jgi:hypothetical protein